MWSFSFNGIVPIFYGFLSNKTYNSFVPCTPTNSKNGVELVYEVPCPGNNCKNASDWESDVFPPEGNAITNKLNAYPPVIFPIELITGPGELHRNGDVIAPYIIVYGNWLAKLGIIYLLYMNYTANNIINIKITIYIVFILN